MLILAALVCFIAIGRCQIPDDTGCTVKYRKDQGPRLSFELDWAPSKGPPGPRGERGPPGPPGPLPIADINRMKAEIAWLKKDIDLMKYGWVSIAGRAYFLGDTPSDWQTARRFCQAKGADLAAKAIRDSVAFKTLRERVVRFKRYHWIGMTDIAQDGRYVFVDGVVANTSDPYWRANEPNGSGDCVDISGIDGLVGDNPCFVNHYPLCEKNL